MCLSAILGIGSSLIGASSASSAQKSQEAAAQAEIELARETRDLTRSDLSPWVGAGTNALGAYNYEMGLGPRPEMSNLSIDEVNRTIQGTGGALGWNERGTDRVWQGGTPDTNVNEFYVGDRQFQDRAGAQAYIDQQPNFDYRGFEETPGYAYQLEQGLDATRAANAVSGGQQSGSVLQALQARGQGMANQEYGNYMDRLGGLAGSGQNAASGLAAANQNYSTQAGNALAAQGNAAAAGSIATGNALQGGINTGLGIWQYQNQLSQPTQQQNSGGFFGGLW